MIVWAHPFFCSNEKGQEDRLLIAAIGDENMGSDVLSKAMCDSSRDKTKILSRIRVFCAATLNGQKMPREICNSLEEGVLELKPGSLRLAFIMDENFPAGRLKFHQAAIFIFCFNKKTQKTPPKTLKRILAMKNAYFSARKSGQIEVKDVVVGNGGGE